MEHVISGDRTSIAYERTGDGSPLVLVHGTGIDHTYWTPVLGTLERALCSLEASLLTPHVRRLVLYEPPIYTTIDIPYPPDALDRFNALLDSGDAEGALGIVYEIGHAPAEEVNLQKSLPNWAARIEATPTLPRELLGAREYKFVGSRFSGMKAPVLLLVGEETIPFYKEATKLLGDALTQGQHGSRHSRDAILFDTHRQRGSDSQPICAYDGRRLDIGHALLELLEPICQQSGPISLYHREPPPACSVRTCGGGHALHVRVQSTTQP